MHRHTIRPEEGGRQPCESEEAGVSGDQEADLPPPGQLRLRPVEGFDEIATDG